MKSFRKIRKLQFQLRKGRYLICLELTTFAVDADFYIVELFNATDVGSVLRGDSFVTSQVRVQLIPHTAAAHLDVAGEIVWRTEALRDSSLIHVVTGCETFRSEMLYLC